MSNEIFCWMYWYDDSCLWWSKFCVCVVGVEVVVRWWDCVYDGWCVIVGL